MSSKVTYHQQVSYCGKPRCRKCREGTGHGPYWYAYKTVDGKTTRTYVGKDLPPEALASMEGVQAAVNIAAPNTGDLARSFVRIYTLGQFRLERRHGRNNSEWQTVTDSTWQQQRVRSLLACLSSSAGRKLGREQIMELLWPDLDFDNAAGRLDRSVYTLRQLFEPSRPKPATSPLLLTEREIIVLAEHPLVWIDADVFEKLLVEARETSDPGRKEELLEEAARLYGGNFLPEFSKQEWSRSRRESLRRSWIGLLLELSDLRSKRSDLQGAVAVLDKLLSADQANEAAVQRMMKLLVQLGRRGEALVVYRRLASLLRSEYAIAPLPETRALYEEVRTGTPVTKAGEASGQGEPVVARPEPTTAPMIQIGRAHQSPLVGREQELGVLRSMLHETEHATKFKLSVQKRTLSGLLDTQRQPQCVLLMGEVGIGKTRLAEEVSREAKARHWAVAWSRVYAQESNVPYRLWTEVLRKAMEQGAWQRQEVSKRSTLFQPLTALLPEMQGLLLPVPYPSTQSPEQEQMRLWEAALALLTLISESTPLLIALDDLQWADASSCELLAYLARRVYGYPIIIVGTCRENELGNKHPLRPLLTDLHRERAVEAVSVQPLEASQIETLVAQMSQVPEPLVKSIGRHAAGNPFFAEELARVMGTQAEAGLLEQINLDKHIHLPETISAVLDLRLSRLSQECRNLLNKAAVLDGSFEFPVITAMEASTRGADEDTVLDLLEEALKSGMLNEEGTGTRITYQFWHPLLVTHLYDRLSAARRASLHRKAADVLIKEYRNREEEGAATITYHLVRGGADPTHIAKWAELAGNHSYKLSQIKNAESFYRTVLEHIDTQGSDTSHLVYLLEMLGECTRIQGKYGEARRFYEQALIVCERAGASTTKQEIQFKAMLWCEIGVTWYDEGNITQAQECYRRGEEVLKEANVLSGPAWAMLSFHQCYIKWREGVYEEAKQIAHKTLELFRDVQQDNKQVIEQNLLPTRIRRALAGDPVNMGRAHSILGMIAVMMSKFTIALENFNIALMLFEQMDSEREISIVCCNLGDLHMRRTEYEQAQSFFRRSMSIAEDIGDMPSVCLVQGNEGVLSFRLGNLPDAEEWFKSAITLAEKINDQVSVSVMSTYLTAVLIDCGKIDEAKKTLYKSLSLGKSTHIDPLIGFALVLLGYLRLMQAQVKMAEQDSKSGRYLSKARSTLKRALSIEGMEAETKTEGQLYMAQVLLLSGEVEAAQELAERTLQEAEQFELVWLIARAQRLLGSICVRKGQDLQVVEYFERAQQTFKESGMRLEYARTLQPYGEALLCKATGNGEDYQRGSTYLQEARTVFKECKAALDLQMVEQALARHGQFVRSV